MSGFGESGGARGGGTGGTQGLWPQFGWVWAQCGDGLGWFGTFQAGLGVRLGRFGGGWGWFGVFGGDLSWFVVFGVFWVGFGWIWGSLSRFGAFLAGFEVF